jgi:glycosyltransferase involved in cell wall biosynthesis
MGPGADAMRILLLTPDAYGALGGISQYVRDFIAAVASYPSCDEIVVLPRNFAGDAGPIPPKVTFVTESAGPKRRFVAAAARELVRSARFDLVICGHVYLLGPALALAARFRAPLLLLAYGIEVWSPPSRFATAACRLIDGYASISRFTAGRFREWAPIGGKRAWILPNAIELARFSPGPRSLELVRRYGLEGGPVIATFGRLDTRERLKGFDEVMEVLPELARTHPGVRYLVIGDGSDRPRLEAKARELGVDDRVVFTGRISEREKVDHLRLPDAFVMPSRGEGFGFVFLESLACGVPVVASSVDGGREAVRDGALGAVVNPRDRQDVLRGIEAALAAPRGQVPAGLEFFSFENFTQRVHAMLDDLDALNGRSARP